MSRHGLSLVLVPALCLASLSVQAQAPTIPADQLAQMDTMLNKWYPANQPGAAVWLVVDGKVIFKKGYGLADMKMNSPIRPEMPFRIGSITKQFTAAAVMKLVEDGKIDVQAPVSRYMKDLPEAWKAITVEQLLTHTSGLHNYTDVESFWKEKDQAFKPEKLLKEFVSKLPLDFEPGTQYRYSNTGYIVLGMLIEKISGQSYPEFLQKRLLEPLGLKHTQYDSDTEPIPDMPVGYVWGPRSAPSWSVTSKYSAGGLVSTAEDLADWTLALHAGKVVKPESLAQMLAPVQFKDGNSEPYGYGLAFRQSQGHRLVGHSGLMPGFLTYLEADPETKAVAVILSNSSASLADDTFFARKMLALAAGQPLPEPKVVMLEPSKLRRLVGPYTLNDQIRTVSFEDGKLYIRLGGYPKLELVPLSETNFKYLDSDENVRFELALGEVIGFHRHYGENSESKLNKLMVPIQDTDPKVTELVKKSLSDLAEGTLKPEVFTRDLAKKLFPDRIKGIREDFRALGSMKSLVLYKCEEKKDGLCLYFYRVGFGEKTLALYLWMTKDRQIADFDTVLE